jgi:hypothetical protein
MKKNPKLQMKHLSIELSSGVILSWSNRLLIISDRNGKTISVIKDYPIHVKNAEELADGRMLTWSVDEEYIIWNINDGSYECINKNDISLLYPYARKWLFCKNCYCPPLVLYSERHTAIINLIGQLSYHFVLKWNGSMPCTPHLLALDGIALVTQETGQVCFLCTYYGNCQISIGELEIIMYKERSV